MINNNNNKIISKLPLLLPSFDDTNYIQQEQNDKFSMNWLVNIVTSILCHHLDEPIFYCFTDEVT